MKKFPKTVYVTWIDDPDVDPYLLSSENMNELVEGSKVRVGIYTLQETVEAVPTITIRKQKS